MERGGAGTPGSLSLFMYMSVDREIGLEMHLGSSVWVDGDFVGVVGCMHACMKEKKKSNQRTTAEQVAKGSLRAQLDSCRKGREGSAGKRAHPWHTCATQCTHTHTHTGSH